MLATRSQAHNKPSCLLATREALAVTYGRVQQQAEIRHCAGRSTRLQDTTDCTVGRLAWPVTWCAGGLPLHRLPWLPRVGRTAWLGRWALDRPQHRVRLSPIHAAYHTGYCSAPWPCLSYTTHVCCVVQYKRAPIRWLESSRPHLKNDLTHARVLYTGGVCAIQGRVRYARAQCASARWYWPMR